MVLAELKIPSDLAELARVRKFVRNLLDFLYPVLGEEGIYQLELAASEAASNIISHAYHGSPSQEILIQVEVFAQRICIRLWHSGKAFNPKSVKPPSFDGSQTSGFGLYLMGQCMDQVDFFGDRRGKNSICMTKNYGKAG
jgi:serine/threonine-protein kinase RsbW